MKPEIKRLSDYLKDYLTYCQTIGKSAGTVKTYGFVLEKFIAAVGDPTPEGLTLPVITAYQNELNGQVSPASCQHYAVCIRNLLMYFRKFHIKTTVELEEVAIPKAGRKEAEFLTQDEIDALIQAADPTKKRSEEIRDRAILETLASTGLRVAELCALKVDDVNLETREVRVLHGKGDKPRLTFLSPEAAHYIKNYLDNDHPDSPYLFVSTKGTKTEDGRINTRSIQRLIKVYATRAGITKNIHPHTLRHSFSSRLLSRGADLKTVQELLGHSNIATTGRYLHITNQALKKNYDNANSSFATKPNGEAYKNEFVVMSKENFYKIEGQISTLRQAVQQLVKGQQELIRQLDAGYTELLVVGKRQLNNGVKSIDNHDYPKLTG